MTFPLSDEEMDREIEVNRTACVRFDGFDRDEDGWDEIWEGMFALLIDQKNGVRKAFDLDPRKSVLFPTFPELLWATCDPQLPFIYSPVFREFGTPVFDGRPAMTTMRFDPWTGNVLPPSVRDAYFGEAEKLLGCEVGIFDDDLDTVPDAFNSEVWWIEKGL